MYRGKLSYRELWNLMQKLPPESLTQTILRDDPDRQELVNSEQRDFGPWALINYQIADNTDAIRHLEYVLAKVFGNEKYQLPEPVPRPGMKRLARHLADTAEVEAARRYLEEFNRGKG